MRVLEGDKAAKEKAPRDPVSVYYDPIASKSHTRGWPALFDSPGDPDFDGFQLLFRIHQCVLHLPGARVEEPAPPSGCRILLLDPAGLFWRLCCVEQRDRAG